MRRTFILAGLLSIASVGVYASNITSATATVGFTYTASGTVNDNQKASELAGVVVQGVFGDGSLFQCTFNASGDCKSGVSGGFEVVVTPPSSNTSSADWNVYNHQGSSSTSANTLVTLTFLGAYGNTVFNPCLTNGVPNISTGGCSGVTPGFGNSASVQSSSGGLNINASVLYTDVVHLANQPANISDTYATIKLTFLSAFLGDNNGGTGNSNSNYFRFGTDTDQVTLTADVPEPTTLSMLGIALAGLGMLRLRRKR